MGLAANARDHLPGERCWFGILLGTGNWRGRVRCMAVLARPLHSEHRLKNTQQLIERSL